MKKILLLILFFYLTSTSAFSQDRNRYLLDIYEYDKELQELVERVVDSLGGKERNLNAQSFRASGEMTFQTGEKVGFDLYYLKKEWFRLDHKTENKSELFVRHGREGQIKKRDTQGVESIQNLKGLKLNEEEQFNIYENNLFDYENKKLDIYHEGEIKVGELEAYIIRLSRFNYGEEMYYISKENYRPFMKQVYFLDGKYQSVINYTIDEYVKMNGVFLPKIIRLKKDGQTKMIEFLSYDLSADFDEEFFLN